MAGSIVAIQTVFGGKLGRLMEGSGFSSRVGRWIRVGMR